jgi:hypothetical protein
MCKPLSPTQTSVLAIAVLVLACKKETEVIPNNQPPDYEGTATVITQNYVNRLFIDLLGREPLDAEMALEVNALESVELSPGAREALVNKLMTSTAYLEDDSSYKNKYHIRQYELYKARCLESVSDDIINGAISDAQQAVLADSLAGNTSGANENNLVLQRLLNLRNARIQYRDGLIGIDEVMRRMVFNPIYDQINMNAFNFINATFDNLLYRYPTQAEFDAAYSMVENNNAAVLFAQSGQNKSDYVSIITGTPEFWEGMVRWSYKTFLNREPSTFETYQAMGAFQNDHDLQKVQRRILISDEYANVQP